MRKPRHKPSQDMVLVTIDRLNHEKAELLEEVRQLRAAVAIYRRIAEHAMAKGASERRVDAA